MLGRICGTGSYVPEKIYDNHDIAKFVDTSDEWIQERTGIIRRHMIEDETTSSMAVEAAKRALENAEVKAEEIDLILVATMTPDKLTPGIACIVQKELKALHATGLDLNAACSGFVFAYNTAQTYITAGMARTVLVIGSESLSNIVDWEDRGSCILFGDGAGAVVLRAEEGETKPFVTHSDGTKGEVLVCNSRHQKSQQQKGKQQANWNEKDTLLKMDGKEVFKFAVKKVPEVISELLQKAGKKTDEIDWFVLHQANKRIIESVAKRMNVSIEKFPMNIQEYGNTSSASIPILLDEMNREGKLKRGQKIVIAGFGAGLSWGASLLEW